MKMTLDLPQALLEKAVSVSTPSKNKRKVVVDALREYVRKNELQELKKHAGSLPDLGINLDMLRDRRDYSY